MKNLLYLVILLAITSTGFANKHYNNWTFGMGAWIYFENANSDPTFVEECAIRQPEGSATYSDKDGNLLFYSDGMTVWNRNHTPITNGTNLIGSPSSFQACYIFPVTGQTNKLYIITIGSTERSNENIYFSIIDYSNGYDNAEITNKNTLITNYNGERAAVIKKPNEDDKYWMILDNVQKPSYLIYSIDEKGIVLNSQYSGDLNKRDNHGGIKISKNANMIVSVDSDASFFEICRFDPFDGVIYENNVINSSLLGTTVFSEEFSPNNKYLYVVSNEVKGGQPITIMNQFDIIDFYKNKSVTLNNIVREPFVWKIGSKEAIQIGPNNKLYIASPSTNYISSIEKPNLEYPACEYIKESVDLEDTEARNGLPSILVDPVIDYVFVDTLLCIDQEFLINFNTNNNSFWTTPDGNTIIGGRIFIESIAESDSGYYHYYDDNQELKYILKIKLTNNDKTDFIDLSPSNYICKGDYATAIAKDYVKEITWKDINKNTRQRDFYEKGVYRYEVVLDNGCVFEDSVVINYKSISPNIKIDGKNCNNNFRILKTYNRYKSFLWSNGETTDSIVVSQSGEYWVKVESNEGCIGYDTVNVEIDTTKKQFDLIPDSLMFCFNESMQHIIEDTKDMNDFFWSNNQKGIKVDFDSTGYYYLVAIDENGCSYFDTIFVDQSDKFEIYFLTLETKMCLDDSAYVELEEIPNVVFEWYDGGNELKRYFNKIGSYSLTAIDTLNGCRLDTVINLSYYPNVISKIDYDAGSEKCESEPKLLESRYKNPNYKYIWNNVDGTDSYLAEESGRYTLIVLDTITGCSDTSFIEIEISDPIQASILGSDICYGGSTVLLADPNNTDYEYIWSTGENTSSITVTNSSEYFVIVSNGDCIDTAYFNVEYLENPNVEIIGESMICKNESATLSSNFNFNSYLWSTGDTTKTIDINSPGTYKLTVTNEFGCIDSTEFVVKEYAIDYELSSKHIDFGKTYLDDSMQESLIIKNLSQFNIRLSNEEYGNIEIGSNDEIELNIDFYATTLGEYLDTLEFEILSPCKSAFYVLVTAEVYTIATISSDYIKTRIGTDIEVPFYISGADKIGQLNLDVETNISNKLFSPDKSLDFNANVLVDPVKQNIYNMKGKTLLSDIIITPIEYINVNSDNKFVEFNLIPGSIEVDSICVFNFRNITLVSDFETTFLVDNEELNIKIEQPTSDESSEYYLELISIDGKKMIDKKIISRNSLIETKMSTSNISSGVYILRVSNMYEVITRKVLITK